MSTSNFRTLLFCAIFLAAGPPSASADDTPSSIKDLHSTVRLLGGARTAKVITGGIAFQLQPGWKTYWRSPGDSGVPPRFDFSQSDNIEAVTVLWPAPKSFPDDAGGFSLGFKNEFILPLRIVTKSADKDATLRATIDYAVCDKLCLPVNAKLELPLTGQSGADDAEIAAALRKLPKPAKVGEGMPTIRGIKRDGQRVIVDISAAEGDDVHLFVEGPTPDWALPIPEQVQNSSSDIRRYEFALDGVPSDAKLDGAALKYTLAGHDAAYEFDVPLK